MHKELMKGKIRMPSEVEEFICLFVADESNLSKINRYGVFELGSGLEMVVKSGILNNQEEHKISQKNIYTLSVSF